MANRELQTEKEHHERAFEYYFSLGERRSYRAVAQEFGVSESTVKLWGRSLRWKQRLRERDLAVAREVASRTITDEVSHRERNLKIVQMAMVKLAKAVADGRVKMTMGDLDKLIRLEAFLRDEPDSRQELVFADLKHKSREEIREMIKEEMETLKLLEHKAPGASWEFPGTKTTEKTDRQDGC